MDYKSIIQSIKNKDFRPVYFFYGEEQYYIDELAKYIENNVLTEEEKEFNLNILYGHDTEVDVLINNAKRYPMGAERQIVILKDSHLMRDLDKLIPYIESPQRSTLLVICHRTPKLDKRTKFAKLILKNSIAFESNKIKDYQVPEWIKTLIEKKGIHIRPEASLLLSEYLGNELSKIDNELNKLVINVPAGEVITTDHIEKFIGISKMYNVFELQNAISTKDIVKANKIVYHFASNKKTNPLVVTMGVLYSFFSKILVYHTEKNKLEKNLAGALKVPPYYVKDYVAAAKNYPLPATKHILSMLSDYDLKSKGVGSVNASDGELLKELVYKIMHQ